MNTLIMCKSIYWWLTDVYLSNEQYLSYIHDKTLGLCPTAEAHFLFRGMEGSEMVDDISILYISFKGMTK